MKRTRVYRVSNFSVYSADSNEQSEWARGKVLNDKNISRCALGQIVFQDNDIYFMNLFQLYIICNKGINRDVNCNSKLEGIHGT